MITISMNSPVPLHDQIVAELRRLLATGGLAIGDELPPVRQLANDLGINLNTVARAYRELTEAGLLASARGRGTVVIASVEASPELPLAQRDRIERILGAALADAKLAGCGPDETRAMIQRQIARIWGDDQIFTEPSR
jgi:GntR family transcriptional regulator